MSKKDLIALDKLLVKLQQHLDAKYVLSRGYEIVMHAREIVEREITENRTRAKEPKA